MADQVMDPRQAASQKSQALKIFHRAKKKDEEHQKKTAIPGLPQTAIGDVPDSPESTDVIPSMLRGDPENTALLDETFKKLYEEIQFLQNQPKKGILDGLSGPRKWRMAGRLALKPWLRSEFEKKMNAVNDERIMDRRKMLLSIGKELGARSIDPIRKAELEAYAKKVGAYEGEQQVKAWEREDIDAAVASGVLSEADAENARRWQFSPKFKANESPSEQTAKYVSKVTPLLSFARQSKLDEKGGEAFIQWVTDSGLEMSDPLRDTFRATFAAGTRVKPPAGETEVQRNNREFREARMQWTPIFNYIKQQNTRKVALNWNELKARATEDGDPDYSMEDAREEGLLVEENILILPIEDVMRMARGVMERYTKTDPKHLDRLYMTIPGEPSDDGFDPVGDAQAAQDYQDYLDSLPGG